MTISRNKVGYKNIYWWPYCSHILAVVQYPSIPIPDNSGLAGNLLCLLSSYPHKMDIHLNIFITWDTPPPILFVPLRVIVVWSALVCYIWKNISIRNEPEDFLKIIRYNCQLWKQGSFIQPFSSWTGPDEVPRQFVWSSSSFHNIILQIMYLMSLSMSPIIQIVMNNAKVHLQVCWCTNPMVFPMSQDFDGSPQTPNNA